MDSYTEKQYNNYDEEPVLYCKDCLSLNIKTTILAEEEIDYCDICGGTNLGECDIIEWEKMYKDRYGHDHLDRSKPKKSIYF